MGYLVASGVLAVLVSLLVVRRGCLCNCIEVITPALCCLTLSIYFAIYAMGWLGILATLLFLLLGFAVVYFTPVSGLMSRVLPNNLPPNEQQ